MFVRACFKWYTLLNARGAPPFSVVEEKWPQKRARSSSWLRCLRWHHVLWSIGFSVHIYTLFGLASRAQYHHSSPANPRRQTFFYTAGKRNPFCVERRRRRRKDKQFAAAIILRGPTRRSSDTQSNFPCSVRLLCPPNPKHTQKKPRRPLAAAKSVRSKKKTRKEIVCTKWNRSSCGKIKQLWKEVRPKWMARTLEMYEACWEFFL